MSPRRIAPLVALVSLLACAGEGPEEGSIDETAQDTAARAARASGAFPPAVAQDPCILVETEGVARWTGSEVRRFEARLPTVDRAGQARAACAAFPLSAVASDVPFFEVAMTRTVDRAPGIPESSGNGVAFAVVEGTAFELRCEPCGDRADAALETIVTRYRSLIERGRNR